MRVGMRSEEAEGVTERGVSMRCEARSEESIRKRDADL